jgi:DNA-directed RNA polymerase subunit M/transcription elongation factor TFIIS
MNYITCECGNLIEVKKRHDFTLLPCKKCESEKNKQLLFTCSWFKDERQRLNKSEIDHSSHFCITQHYKETKYHKCQCGYVWNVK